MLKIFAKLQTILPHYLLSKLIYKLAMCKISFIKNFFIKLFIKKFQINLAESLTRDPAQFVNFNDFFTRQLDLNSPQSRKINLNSTIISPVDGTVLTAEHISNKQLFQAKGRTYSLEALLGETTSPLMSTSYSKIFENGSTFTIYLAPQDYHRVHMPYPGKLLHMIYIPGRLFAVNPTSCNNINNIFARNERVINIFQTDFGYMAVILVGALLVGSMATSWHGVITPPHGKRDATKWDYSKQNIMLNKADEVGFFQMGSTVIVLFSKKFDFLNTLINDSIKFGQEILK
jgi:phosphatidylserine decarboxylase